MSDETHQSHQSSQMPPRSRRRWPWFLLVVGVIPFMAAGWLGYSESGLKFLCSSLVRLSAERLQIEAPSGRLLGDWQVQTLRWQDATLDVELQQLRLDWTPSKLLHRQLTIERIEATSLRIFSTPSSEPAKLPASLRLPLNLSIKHLALGQVSFGKSGESSTLLAEGIEGALSNDGQRYLLENLRARLGLLTLSVQATLGTDSPFQLKADSELQGRALEHPFVLKLSGDGPLEQVQLEGKIIAGESEGKNTAAQVSGDFQALLTPFALQPVASLSLQAKELDPSVFVISAPQALLDIEAKFESKPAGVGESAASGRLRINNRRSGALDRQLLPVDALQTQLDWQGERLSFDGLVLALAGGGQLRGQGSLASQRLDLALTAQGLNAQALHGRLLPTRLVGSVQAQIGRDSQSFELDLHDSQYAVKTRAKLTPEVVELSHLQLSAGDARLNAEGRLALTGDQRFTGQGHLQNFDPARFLRTKAPVRSLFNADLTVKGALNPALALALHFDLRDSRLGDQKIAGKGDVDLLGDQLRKIDLDLDAAGNHLTALGAFGKPGDKLRLKLQAPKFEALRWAGLVGDANADLLVGGSVTNPEFSGELQATHLQLAKLLDLKDLSLNVQLGAGPQGKLDGLLRCAVCAFPDYGIPALSLELKAEGQRDRHHLSASIGLPEKRELRFALEGGMQAETGRKSGSVPATFWSGTLSEMRVNRADSASAKPLLQLTGPAALRVGGASVGGASISFGPATIDGLLGDLHIERLAYEQGRWQSTGRWQQFRPQTLLAEFPSHYAGLDAISKANPQPLVLGGEWDFSLDNKPAAQPVGRAAVWRESGDLVLGELSLGLNEARLQASLGEGRLLANAKLRGARLGDISAEWSAVSARAADGRVSALLDTQAPWQGHLQARVPDLAWLGALLGEGWQVAGKLDGDMRLAGSAAHPQFSGEWHGQELALRALDQGMRLERGDAQIEITPERLLLRRLSFESDFQPMPKVLKFDPNIDVTRLTGTPGRLGASGELDFSPASEASSARMSFRLDRLGVIQRPDQWVALSGEGEVRVGERELNVDGKLRADAGFWSLADTGRPSLSDDVVIRQVQSGRRKSAVPRALHLDLQAALGRSFHFHGAGVESRLAGQIRLRSDDAGLPRASGSIQTVDGRFDAYGQKLGIQRGIINFQGAIDNPGLNILAVRENLPVEAGVEVTGTAQRPVIRLVSTPMVPDAEKLSWLVLGHSSEQQGGGDSTALLAAAQAILGGQNGGTLRQLQQGLGIDEIGVSSGQIGGYANQPTSRVASSTGFGGSQTMNEQIVSVGKRLSSNAMLSYEQSLNTSDSLVKLTVNLGRQFSVVGRAGSESALDFFWNYSFGK